MDLRQLIFSLLLSLCGGVFLSFALVKVDRVGRRYFVYHGLGAAAVAGAFLFLHPETSVRGAGLAFALFCGLFSVLHGGSRRWLAWAAFAGGVAALGLTVWRLAPTPWLRLHLMLSALLLGFGVAAMLVGHWYLVVPKLPIEELERIVLAFLAVLVVRALVGAVSAWPLVAGKSEMELYRYLASTSGIFLVMRWFWGILGPLGLAYFLWDTVRLRSTQSATGILYVAVIFVLIGETMSQYLTFFHGIPG